jgi:hypothetical protein
MSNDHTFASDVSAALEDRIRERAYLISQSVDSGTPEENWLRAQDEVIREGDGESHAVTLGTAGSAASVAH